MSISRDWLESLTWRCDICRRERPDAKISVHKVDIGPAGLPAGTVIRNVKYCNDNPNCHDAALNWKEDERRRRITS
jgi:hypothetical protein